MTSNTLALRPVTEARAHRGAVLLVVLLLNAAAPSQPDAAHGAPRTGVIELLEDHPEPLLKELEGQGGGEGIVETRDVFSGKAAVKIIPMQRFRRDIPGWGYSIRERPNVGEYRYLRFAWRADGAGGIMLQLHDEKDWNIRFTAGVDEPNWGTKFVAPQPPTTWTVVTRDLFAEFGDRRIHGIALTVFGGTAGYFDHIYLGRSIDDLDRIDATGLGEGPPRVTPGDLDRLWADLGSGDVRRTYLAFWTLKSVPDRSIPFIGLALLPPTGPDAIAEMRRWIEQLGAEDYAFREAATRHLSTHRDVAAGLLKEALHEPDVALEMRIRIEQILNAPDSAAGASDRVEKAVRVLVYVGTDEARSLLDHLAKGDAASPVTRAAAVARRRAAARREP